MVDHIADEVDQVILGQPFTQARRKQKPLFWKVRTVALAHDSLCTTPIPVPPAQSLLSTGGLSQTHLTSPTDYFSDTLLGPLIWCGLPPCSNAYGLQNKLSRIPSASVRDLKQLSGQVL